MREGYSSSFVVSVCVCVSVLSILPSCAFRRPRGISNYSVENAVKLRSRFSSKFRGIMNLP